MERYPRGQRGPPAKGLAGQSPGEGSNPSLSAILADEAKRCPICYAYGWVDIGCSLSTIQVRNKQAADCVLRA